ncbi:hypothetical protein [Mesomycoplasma neurolyticum]|uniref:Uncharacterized protein n=1 Tax=Mesomycoplasma neurolyticum TaxID=2120 RepID=A0A449A525_9BACT|nr:hypothetical protein [Mesomycoplasma neurolyticum]VEU59337.1 Uncharacterised protein [Mesomycoplasma neurolyticum]
MKYEYKLKQQIFKELKKLEREIEEIENSKILEYYSTNYIDLHTSTKKIINWYKKMLKIFKKLLGEINEKRKSK